MISHLTDADWLIDFLKGKDEAVKLLAPLIEEGSLSTSIIVYGEIFEGLIDAATQAPSPRGGVIASFGGYQIGGVYVAPVVPLELYHALDNALAGILIVGLDRQTAEVFAHQRASLRAQGQLVPDHDLWISATALRYDLTLISRDRHFERIPGLKLYRPS